MPKDINELFTSEFIGQDNNFRAYIDSLLAMSLDNIEVLIRDLVLQGTIYDSTQHILEKIATWEPIAREEYTDKLLLQIKALGGRISKQVLKKSIESLVKKTSSDFEIIEDNLLSISPAQDFSDTTGYIAVPLDVKIKTKKEGIEAIEIVTIPHIVSSGKQLIQISGDYIQNSEKLIHLKSEPVFLRKTRWKYHDIKNYLKSTEEKQDVVDIFQECSQLYEKYLDFKEPFAASMLSIWTIGTYLYQVFDAYPYIFLTGEKGSGKTKTHNVFNYLCFNAIASSDMSPAILFRTVESSGGTILIDEAEKIKDPKVSQDFRLLLNAGYKKGGMAHRAKPDTFEPQSFNIYSPKAIANIKGLEDVLESRCVTIVMLRTRNKEISNRSINDRCEDWFAIRDKLYRTSLDWFQEIRNIYFEKQKSIDFIYGRAAELWLPILSITELIDRFMPGIYPVIKEYCLTKVKEQDYETDAWTEAVIRTVKYLINSGQVSFKIKTIKENIKLFLETEADEHMPTSQWIGYCLKRLGFGNSKNRKKVGGNVVFTIELSEILDVMERLGIQDEEE